MRSRLRQSVAWVLALVMLAQAPLLCCCTAEVLPDAMAVAADTAPHGGCHAAPATHDLATANPSDNPAATTSPAPPPCPEGCRCDQPMLDAPVDTGLALDAALAPPLPTWPAAFALLMLPETWALPQPNAALSSDFSPARTSARTLCAHHILLRV